MSFTETVLFRPMKITDLPTIMQVEKLSFADPWSESSFVDELISNELAYYIVPVVDGQVAGYAGMWVVLEEAQITNIAIHPDFRGQGLGKATLFYLMELAKQLGSTKMTLEVRKSNEVAQFIYRRQGFSIIGTRTNYYPDNGEDAILMDVKLTDE
jgi:[ribosomal protein S18]-alanine N-acetyltransferase